MWSIHRFICCSDASPSAFESSTRNHQVLTGAQWPVIQVQLLENYMEHLNYREAMLPHYPECNIATDQLLQPHTAHFRRPICCCVSLLSLQNQIEVKLQEQAGFALCCSGWVTGSEFLCRRQSCNTIIARFEMTGISSSLRILLIEQKIYQKMRTDVCVCVEFESILFSWQIYSSPAINFHATSVFFHLSLPRCVCVCVGVHVELKLFSYLLSFQTTLYFPFFKWLELVQLMSLKQFTFWAFNMKL